MVVNIVELIEQASQAFGKGESATMEFLRTGSSKSLSNAKKELEHAREICSGMNRMILVPVLQSSVTERLGEIAQLANLLNRHNAAALFNAVPESASYDQIQKFFLRKFKDPAIAHQVANAYVANMIGRALSNQS